MSGLIPSHAERLAARKKKARRLLAFLSSEIWTTVQVAGDVMRLSSRSAVWQTLKSFEKEGWIVFDEIDPPGRRLVGITADGQAWVAGLIGKPIETRVYQRGRVGLATIEHRIQLQRLRIAAARAGWKNWVYPDRLPVNQKNSGRHRPDALVTTNDGTRVAIELERTLKTLKRYRVICSAHLDAIGRREYDRVIYICPDAGRAAAVRKIFQSLGRVLVGGRDTAITTEMLSKFVFTTPETFTGEKNDR